MSLCPTYARRVRLALIVAVALVLLPAVMKAQDIVPPKVDLFVGYQWLNPGGTVPLGPSYTPTKLPGMPGGAAGTVTYNFNKWVGLSADVSGNFKDQTSEETLSVGPRLMWRGEGVDFFVHTMAGMNHLSPNSVPGHTGFGAVMGGGIDLNVTQMFSIRLFEADYVLGRQNFAGVAPATDPGLQRPVLNGAAIRAGIVFNFGELTPPTPVSASCSVQNPQVMVGEPVQVSVQALNFNPKHTLTYTWAASGGRIQGKDTAATIDTNGVAGGDYTATATVTDPKAKNNNTASCTGRFTVKEPPKNPPQISCSASPSSVQTGTPATISCTCQSPDGVPVSIGNWSSTGGSISGSGNTATLNTSGAPAGTITVNATCTDSRGLTASSTASVTVENPPPPPPQASKLNECDYPNKVKPWRVDNTCKAELDDVASKLQQDPDAKLVVVGNAGDDEIKHSKHKNLAAERAVDVKYYLTQGEAQQHIDASRIECRTGSAGSTTSEQWIVPAGATFPNESSTQPVDETKVKPIPDHPHAPAKKAAKKAQ
jgi:hypothetical protein